MSIKLATMAVVLGMALAGPGHAADMVFTSWGGTTQDAQNETWGTPFTEATGVNVLLDGPTDYGKLQAMVEAGQVVWDVVDVEYDFAVQAAKAGLLEPIDFSIVDRAAIDPRFVNDHAVVSFPFSFVLAYNTTAFDGNKPENWADLFDTAKFPGKRAFYKWSSPGALEIALLADGVAPKDLYPLDLDLAFAKLDTIKKDIVWWGGGAQSQQLIASGETPMGMFWDLRLFPLQASGQPVSIVWTGSLASADMLVVPKGAPNKDAAMKFLATAASAKGQAEFMAKITSEVVEGIEGTGGTVQPVPTDLEATRVSLDLEYWGNNREKIAERWYAWQAE